MALEIPSGPDDVFLGMEDSRCRTSSLEQEMIESSGGGGVGSGGLYVGSGFEIEKTLANWQFKRLRCNRAIREHHWDALSIG